MTLDLISKRPKKALHILLQDRVAAPNAPTSWLCLHWASGEDQVQPNLGTRDYYLLPSRYAFDSWLCLLAAFAVCLLATQSGRISLMLHTVSLLHVGRHERITGLRLQLTYLVAESIMCLGCGGSWPGGDASYTHSSTDSAYYCGMLRSKASLSLLSEPWPTRFCQSAYDDLHS